MKTKTLLLILSLIAGATTVQAQSQLKTVKGKTKDGKSIVVRYYQGAFEDNIESVKYEVIDELNNELKEKEKKLREKEKKLREKENAIKRLEGEKRKLDDLEQKIIDTVKYFTSLKPDTITITKEVEKIVPIEDTIKTKHLNDSIKGQWDSINTLHNTIEDLKSQIEKYKKVPDVSPKDNSDEMPSKEIKKGKKIEPRKRGKHGTGNAEPTTETSTDSTPADTLNTSSQVNPNGDAGAEKKEEPMTVQPTGKDSNAAPGSGQESQHQDVKTPEGKGQSTDTKGKANKTPHVIGFEARMGHVLYGHTVNEGWNHDVRFSKHVEVYYGSPRLAKSFSIEAGVGATLFGISANRPAYELILDGQSDIDNDTYQAQYTYSDLSERLSLVYLDIPVRLCFNQHDNGHAMVYGKIGLTPSVLLHSEFSGEGTYTQRGYYEDLQVTLEDIPELGFVTNANCYKADEKPEMSRFTLWGNLEAGVYVPCGKKSPVQLNFGVKVDYPITSFGKAAEVEALPEGAGLLYKGKKVIVPSVAVGIIYLIKKNIN